MTRRTAARLFLLAAALGVAALLAEGGVRLALEWTGKVPWLERDETIGWINRASLRDHLVDEGSGSFRVSTDRFGRRLTRSDDAASAPAAAAVVLVGDSMVFGHGVDDEETFAWRLAEALGRPVINLGVSGYGPEQQLLRFSRHLSRHPEERLSDVVVLAFENDLVEVLLDSQAYLGMSKPRFVPRAGGYEPKSISTSVLERLADDWMVLRLLQVRLALFREPAYIDPEPGIEPAAWCLRSICRLATERGARCHLLALRQIEGWRSPPGVWRRFLHLSGAEDITPLIDGNREPALLGYDGWHWSAEGHRRMAALVASKLLAQQRPAAGLAVAEAGRAVR